jgi:3-methyladenine DNA glycosylase/8-oxoguanine DNA glycosylase
VVSPARELDALELVGPGGEPVDLWRTILSHGLVELPPMRVDEDQRALELTVPVPAGRPRLVRIEAGQPRRATVRVEGRLPGARANAAILSAVRHVLRLDEDLAPFYAVAELDAELSWATEGAGRMIRSLTVFEDVVKTICTTNCAWSATVRMVGGLVEHLGEPALGAPAAGPFGRTFPTPEAMAAAGDAFYTDVVRAGYRGRYLYSLATSVAEGSLDLAGLEDPALPDDEVERRLLALPGVGPYAAAHIMMMGLGRYSKLILDSWTRPKYASVSGGKPVADPRIVRRFRGYGPYAGLAFWLTVTEDWA